MPVCKSAVCVCRGINRHRVYGNLRSGVIIIIFCCFFSPINVMSTGGRGEAGHGVGIWLFSKICNQIPCPRANHSSQNNNLGHKGEPSKNFFVKRGVIIYYRSYPSNSTSPLSPIKNERSPFPPPYRIPHQRHQCSSSLHDWRFMSQAGRTRYFARSTTRARSARRGKEKNKALFFFSPCLALRARVALRAKYCVRPAWLIKRQSCRLVLEC